MRPLLTAALTFCIALLISVDVKAQNKDYVILTNGDKLACMIKFPLLSAEGQYKVNDGDEPRKLDPYELNEYYIAESNALYRAVYEPEAKALKFMKVLENGEINVYECKYIVTGFGSGKSTVTFRYLAKGKDIFREFKPRPLYYDKEESNWKDSFIDLIADKKDVYDKYVAEKKYSFKQVIKIAHLYNNSPPAVK